MSHTLTPGTILDGRYRLDRVLGEGGFGITYAAVNVRLGLKVAVKELFWREHSRRDVSVSPEVVLARGEERDLFARRKDLFLKEARTLRDFSDLGSIVRVLDYFESNGTAYIVMEYVGGETLSAHAARTGGRMNAQEFMRLMLPLIGDLRYVHAAGVIHRDISPDNIMIQPDGTLKLIDFGTARQFSQEETQPSAVIARVSYAPGEQYDRNGRQGPWTDVYSLCATMYHCVTGAPPDSAVQRLFLDELKAPSEMGADIDAACEAVIMKGMSLTASKRFQSMDELADAVRAALPRPKAPPARKRTVLAAFAAGAAALALIAGVLMWIVRVHGDRFRGIEMERLRVTAAEDMTASEFAAGQQALREWLDAFAGENNYIMTVDGDRVDIALPLSVYAGREITDTTIDTFTGITGWDGTKMSLTAEVRGNWEDPAGSLTAGENQTAYAALTGRTLILGFSSGTSVTKGVRAAMITEMKTRLDALDTPYAFGTLYGDDNTFLVRISPDCVGYYLTDTLGASLPLLLGGNCTAAGPIRIAFNRYAGRGGIRTALSDGGDVSLIYRDVYGNPADLLALAEILAGSGEDTIFLQTAGGIPIAGARIDGIAEDGALTFTDLYLEGGGDGGSISRMTGMYVDALVNQSSLDTDCFFRFQYALDGEGRMLFDQSAADWYGVTARNTPASEALLNVLKDIASERGYGLTSVRSPRAGRTYELNLNMDADETLRDRIAGTVPDLIGRILGAAHHPGDTVRLVFIREEGDERCRVFFHTAFDYSSHEIYTAIGGSFSASGRLEPYRDALNVWWDSFDAEAYGMRKTE